MGGHVTEKGKGKGNSTGLVVRTLTGKGTGTCKYYKLVHTCM